MLNFRGVSSTNLLEEHKSTATVTRSLRKQQDFLKGWQIKQPVLYGIIMKSLTVLVFMVALFTVTARCRRLCGGVVLTAVL